MIGADRENRPQCASHYWRKTWRARDEMVVADLDPDLLHMCTGRRWIQSRRPSLSGPLTEPAGKEQDTRTVRFARE